jgi:hypothetical protein
MVSSSHPAVTAAALDVLRSGGNAVDAMLTAMPLEQVLEPHLSTIAGGFAMLVWHGKTGTAHYLNAHPDHPHGVSLPGPDGPDVTMAPGRDDAPGALAGPPGHRVRVRALLECPGAGLRSPSRATVHLAGADEHLRGGAAIGSGSTSRHLRGRRSVGPCPAALASDRSPSTVPLRRAVHPFRQGSGGPSCRWSGLTTRPPGGRHRPRRGTPTTTSGPRDLPRWRRTRRSSTFTSELCSCSGASGRGLAVLVPDRRGPSYADGPAPVQG